MPTHLANYEDQQQAFFSLFEPECDCRILLIRGESGSGKTTFLEYCQERIPPHIANLPIQLRNSAVGVAEFFSRSGRWLGWERMNHLTHQVANFQSGPTVRIDRNWLAGINNHISVALHAESLTDREERRTALTDALFDDLQGLTNPALVVFDTFEQATSDVQDWISGPFLARAAQVKQLRVVVAGQKVPAEHNIEWRQCCVAHDLLGVAEARYWMPVVTAMGRRIAVERPVDWLAGVCHVLKGNPAEIIKIIQGLPRAEILQ